MTITTCMVTNMYPTDDNPGYGVFIKSQIDSITAAGHDVDVIFIDGRKSSWNYLAAVVRLRRMLKNGRYDVVHAHYGLSGMVARAQRRCPVVVSFCGDDLLGTSNGRGGITLKSRLLVWLGQVLAKSADGIILKSEQMKERLAFSSARQRAMVIPNGVDLEMFRPLERGDARDALGMKGDMPYVLFAGAPRVRVKRFDLAQAAVAIARKVYHDVELVTLDARPQSEVPLYMSACDVMLVTSDSEGSPNMVKEAMACNLPVVSVDAGDAWQVMGDAEHCHRAEREVADIADKLGRVLAVRARSDGRKHIGHLGLGAVAERVIGVYQEVLRRG
ncbi:MAG: glycosyltransferase [Candidatus Krumholzibacteria bacterium]